MYRPENPIIVQSDKSILLEVDSKLYFGARDALARFAELEKSPEHIHTYRISPISLWNAASSGHTVDDVLLSLNTYSKYDIPQNIIEDIKDFMGRYGKIKLATLGDELVLSSSEEYLVSEIWHNKKLKASFKELKSPNEIVVLPYQRGHIKQELINYGFPVEDLAGYSSGTPLSICLLEIAEDDTPFKLRYYQQESVDVFYASGSSRGGSGVIVLPCGAGKTLIGIAAIEKCQCETLILVTNITALKQWKSEIVNRTSMAEDMIGEYSGEKKEVKPITIVTYQILTYRKSKTSPFSHFDIFNKKNWGLVIYDEVHLLPAPIFRVTAEVQSLRRLGLTATLVREDGKEKDVFSLIGPKKYDVPWKTLEKQGWIAKASCTEIRIPMPEDIRMEYAISSKRSKFRISSENHIKLDLIKLILKRHEADRVLIIGQYIAQIKEVAKMINAPVITGSVPTAKRNKLFKSFKDGEIRVLVVSKVANFAVDLPEANVAIQISGTFGSRQEEAQRLGRILRPKAEGDNVSSFYSLVSRDTCEQEFATKRQLFLTEQGYKYNIVNSEEIFTGEK